MKYVPPIGAQDANAAYVDGNPSAGIEGSLVSAAAIEHPMREIVEVIAAAGLAPSAADLKQLLAAIRRLSLPAGGGTLSGALLGKVGAAAPGNEVNAGYAFDGDVDTGLFCPTNGGLQLAVGGVPFLSRGAGEGSTHFADIPFVPTADPGSEGLEVVNAAFVRAAMASRTLDATLIALANLVTSADRMIYATGEDAFALTVLTAYARTLLAAANAAAARATLGAAPLESPALTGTPTAPTPAAGNNSTRIATTAFVQTTAAAGNPNALVGVAVLGDTGNVLRFTRASGDSFDVIMGWEDNSA
jgi:hypothetical protein